MPGREWVPDSEHGQLAVDTGTAYLTLLAVEAVHGAAAAVNQLTSDALTASTDHGMLPAATA